MNRAATLNPDGAAFINAVEVLPFSEGAVFQLYTTPERISDIMLQPGELLASVASGDTTRWIIGDTSSGSGADKRVHVLVKPFAPGLATNLLIMTDRRSYHLSLKSHPRIATSALSWTYPQDALIALKGVAAGRLPSLVSGIGATPDHLHFNYVISGDRPRWRPIRAFDDGEKSYIEFPPGIETDEAPPLFLISGRDAQLVNYRMQGRFYVVDRLFDTAELRLGTHHAITVRIRRTQDVASPAGRRDGQQ
jgi:type IV secretion system protein VirB9